MELGRLVTLVYGFSGQGQEALIRAAMPVGCRWYRNPENDRHPTEVVEWLNSLIVGLEDQVVIQTHSEVIVTYLRAVLALGVMSPEDVKVYWVSRESGTPVATGLGLTGGGGFRHSWPEGYFAEKMRIINAEAIPIDVRSKA